MPVCQGFTEGSNWYGKGNVMETNLQYNSHGPFGEQEARTKRVTGREKGRGP